MCVGGNLGLEGQNKQLFIALKAVLKLLLNIFSVLILHSESRGSSSARYNVKIRERDK